MTTETETIYREFELEVEFDFYKGCRGARERGSGVQLEPDEPASCEVNSVTLIYKGKDGKEKRHLLDLPDEIIDDIVDDIAEDYGDYDGGF